MRFTIGTVVVLLVLAGAAHAGDQVTATDMKLLGLAYHSYSDDNKGKAPTKADDLAKYFEKQDKVLGYLKSGQIVFIYNVRIVDMIEGTSNTVIAYQKDVPEKGGLILYGDGSTRTLKADEFKKATLAKPKKN